MEIIDYDTYWQNYDMIQIKLRGIHNIELLPIELIDMIMAQCHNKACLFVSKNWNTICHILCNSSI